MKDGNEIWMNRDFIEYYNYTTEVLTLKNLKLTEITASQITL